MIATRIKFFVLFLVLCVPVLAQEVGNDEFYNSVLENQEVLISEVHSLSLTISDMMAQNEEISSDVESIRGAVAFVLIASALSFGSLLFISYSQRR